MRSLQHQVCRDLKAVLLIDDSSENALRTATDKSSTPVLLFGDYQWNQRICKHDDACEEMAFSRRFEAEGKREFWKEVRPETPMLGVDLLWSSEE
jgi:uncharacterized membrane protein